MWSLFYFLPFPKGISELLNSQPQSLGRSALEQGHYFRQGLRIKIMFKQEEAKFLLEAVLEKSVATNLNDVINGLKPSPMVENVVKQLREMAGLNEAKEVKSDEQAGA